MTGWTTALLLLACAPPQQSEDAPSQVSVAPLANDGCFAIRPPGLPAEIDELVVQRSSLEGWSTIDRVPPTGPTALLTGVDAGDTLLRFIACEDGSARYAARPAETAIGEAGKAGLTLHFKPLGRLACTGTTQGPAYNRFAALGRARAFAAAAPLSAGRVLVVGGADTIEGGVLSIADADQGWDLYTAGESLFLPGVDRAVPLSPRPTLAPRVAAHALPWQAPGAAEPGVLVIGGVPAMRQQITPTGPFLPDGPAVSRPAAEYFDPAVGAFAPVEFVDGAVLAERFQPGAAVDELGRIVIAGGVDWPDGTASDLVEIIAGDTLQALTLPPAPERVGGDPRQARNGLAGPTVTALGEGRFLIWGADLNGCGQRPGWLVSLDPTPRVEELTVVHPESPPTCNEAPGCRPWYATAHHAATRLTGPGDLRRVLVTGGIAVGPGGLSNNPDPGEPCAPNALVLEIDPGALTVTVNTVSADFEAAGALKRAFHTVTPAGGGRVLIAGGWAFLGNATLLQTADDVLFYRDARPAGRIERSVDRLTVPRMGGFATAIPNVGVVLGGGLVRPDGEAAFTATEAAEIYTAPIDTPACVEGG